MEQHLAFRMRPKTIDQVVGQEHLIGKGKVIRQMVERKKLISMIFYGPPGIGKTSLAGAIAGTSHLAFRTFNATIDNKKRLQEIAEEAKFSGGLVLLLDEIHRLDKAKQDFLLPLLEMNQLILIGATTENPFFAVAPALRSRLHIFELEPLSTKDLKKAIQVALTDPKRGLSQKVALDPDALDFLIHHVNGDLRLAFQSLELAVLSASVDTGHTLHLSLEDMKNCLQKGGVGLDKGGDGHYDVLSALQKSIRGSDVDASLHYAARLIAAGDLKSLARRLIVIAYEDIGLANPAAQIHTVTALEAAEKIGLPEARILISNVVIDLALSPKSNSAMIAMDKALADVQNKTDLSIPRHLRDGHYKGSQTLGNGVDYLYPHDFPEKWVHQSYLPKGIFSAQYYRANQTGKYEKALGITKEKIDRLKQASDGKS